MKYKVLFFSTVAIFSHFNLPFMRWFKEQGWQVDYVSDGEIRISDCDNQYAIPIKRNPFNYYNIAAYKELKKILLNDYDIIHCHTPMGGVLGRLAAKNMRIKAKVIYTAHGFHFYKGAPLRNWLIYYPIEKYLAQYTDALITINGEDYNIAKKCFLSCKNIYKINGMGVELSRYFPRATNERMRLREELGYTINDYIITNIAEITKNKNQKMLIKILPNLKHHIPALKVLFVGFDGYSTKGELESLVNKLQLQNIVHFLGFREDADKFAAISDIAFSASIREGLGLGIIEAMACGIPIVCSDNRGHKASIINGYSGLLFSNENEMIENILRIYNSKALARMLGENAVEAVKKYERKLVIEKMSGIYLSFSKGDDF